VAEAAAEAQGTVGEVTMMRNRSKSLRRAILLALVPVLCALVIQADTTVIDVQFGDSFTGTIEAGVDTVQARFFAAEGATVRITVQAAQGSSLQPTVVVRDGSGAALDSGADQEIGWLPVANVLHYVTIPDSGMYFAEIGGSSGSGGFWARILGESSNTSASFLSGTVTDSLTEAPVADVDVKVDDSLFAITDEDGSYSGELDAGSYSVSFEAEDYETLSQPLNLAPATPAVLDAALIPTGSNAVMVEASVSGDEVAGGVLTATVDISAPPGTTINSITWTQEYGASAGIADADTDTATVTLGTTGEYKDELIHILSEPPIGEDQLPPNVPVPPGEFPGGLQNRFQVVGINPFALEETALVVLKVEVDTSRGVVSDEVEIHTALPWKVSTGLRNVSRGIPVLIHGKEQASYDWTLFPPAGSGATLTDATSQTPYFTPDVSGLYQLEVSDLSEEARQSTLTLQIYAGTWQGVIVGQDVDGRPVPDTACTLCHNGILAPDKFTEWAQTGHAEIFTNNLNTSTHYGEGCFSCHTVGFDPGVENGGVDNAPDYQDFLDAGLLNNPGDNWTTVLDEFPDTAQLANIQCENCHGAQNSNAHGFAGPLGEPRVNLSSDVCATCHGEPLRHARFQQWQLSAHANYEVAIDESQSGSCSRCHTGNGFLTWLPILLDDDPNTDPTEDIFYCDDTDTCVGGANAGQPCDGNSDCPPLWTEDEAHPQTCATCHDPHAIGTTSGGNTNATVRISGDTPPLIAGFQAFDVGRGAICMTCHNSRRGLRNDDTFDDFSTSEKTRAPHGSAQTDVLMGENAYFVSVGDRGGHSFTEDSCVSCHMEATPPPDDLSYNQGGTNHTFYADRNICSECHSSNLTADNVQNGVQHLLDQVQVLMEDRLLDLIGSLTDDDHTIHLNPTSSKPDGDATIVDVNDIAELEFGETRGRQAITVTFVDDVTLGPYRMSDVDVRDDTGADVGTLYAFAEDDLIKAGWNWNLFNNDGSIGVHNPFFANGALSAARDALVRVSGGQVPDRGAAESRRGEILRLLQRSYPTREVDRGRSR
jgi:hypothetical protein